VGAKGLAKTRRPPNRLCLSPESGRVTGRPVFGSRGADAFPLRIECMLAAALSQRTIALHALSAGVNARLSARTNRATCLRSPPGASEQAFEAEKPRLVADFGPCCATVRRSDAHPGHEAQHEGYMRRAAALSAPGGGPAFTGR